MRRRRAHWMDRLGASVLIDVALVVASVFVFGISAGAGHPYIGGVLAAVLMVCVALWIDRRLTLYQCAECGVVVTRRIEPKGQHHEHA